MLAGGSVIVTGAAAGIGFDTACLLAGQAGHVIALDRDPIALPAALRGRIATLQGDVGDPALIAAALAAVPAGLPLRGLVNNAGIVVNGTALTTTLADWNEAFRVNVTALFLWAQAVLPAMVAAGGGSIVNIGSVIGPHGRQDGVAYVASKGAVMALTRSLALDFGRQGVRCNTVSPGAIETPMLTGFLRSRPEQRQAMIDKSYVGRLGTGQDIAAAVAFLLSDAAGFINGAELTADGGMTAAL